jgi:hypothetical protein
VYGIPVGVVVNALEAKETQITDLRLGFFKALPA